MSFPDEYGSLLRGAFKESGMQGVHRQLEWIINDWKSVPVVIGVTGNSGSGKSTFVNALRNLEEDDNGWAPVGVNETTMKPKKYTYSNEENLELWDLPGVGTERFPKESYLEDIGFKRYDFFIIITATRFTENDHWLGREMKTNHRKFFFVRTKIQEDINNDRKVHRKTHNADNVVNKIRTNCEENMPEFKDIVFLIDSYEPAKFDFEKLKLRMIEDFPVAKRQVLVSGLTALSEEMVKIKISCQRWKMFASTFGSASVAAIPVPGLSLATDWVLIAINTIHYFTELGLDEQGLNDLANVTGSDCDVLRGLVKTSGIGAVLLSAGNIRRIPAMTLISASGQALKNAIEEVISKETQKTAAYYVEEFVRPYPVFGQILAAGISFGTTYITLNEILDHFEEIALKVIKAAVSKSAESQ